MPTKLSLETLQSKWVIKAIRCLSHSQKMRAPYTRRERQFLSNVITGSSESPVKTPRGISCDRLFLRLLVPGSLGCRSSSFSSDQLSHPRRVVTGQRGGKARGRRERRGQPRDLTEQLAHRETRGGGGAIRRPLLLMDNVLITGDGSQLVLLPPLDRVSLPGISLCVPSDEPDPLSFSPSAARP